MEISRNAGGYVLDVTRDLIPKKKEKISCNSDCITDSSKILLLFYNLSSNRNWKPKIVLVVQTRL